MSGTDRRDEKSAFHACVLSAVAGYADTLGYLTYGAFAGLLTGNTVLLGIAVAHGDPLRALHYATIIVAFLAGVGMVAVLQRRGVRLSALLVVETVALIASALIGAPLASPVLAFAMGLQNAAVTRFAGATLNTVFITGDLQKLALGLTARIVRAGALTPEVVVVAWIWGGYLGGVLLGAGAFAVMNRPLLLAPILLPLSFIVPARRAGASYPPA